MLQFMIFYSWKNICYYSLERKKSFPRKACWAVEIVLLDLMYLLIMMMWLTHPDATPNYTSRQESFYDGMGMQARDSSLHGAATQASRFLARPPQFPLPSPPRAPLQCRAGPRSRSARTVAPL
jgi:hypothetical protein